MYNEENTCPICMNEYETDNSGNKINYAVTKCGHAFCLSCLIVSAIKKDECPLCRNVYFTRPANTNNNNNDNSNPFFPPVYNTFSLDEDSVSNWYYGNLQERLQETSRLFYNDFFDFQVEDVSLNAYMNNGERSSYASIVRDVSNNGIFNPRNAEYFAFSENDVD